MNKSINRLVCVVLAVVALLVYLPYRNVGNAVLANLQMQFRIAYFTGDLTIVSVTGDADQYELPETLQGHKVVGLGENAFTRVNGLSKLTIPACVTSIESRAVGYNSRGKTDGFVIVGYGGSAAETYAKNNGIDFVDLAGPAVEIKDADVPFSSPSGYMTTGLTGRHVMTKREIINTLKAIPASTAQNLYTTTPSAHAPYKAGEVSALTKQVTLQRLNLYRALAGLNSVRYETEYEPYCQRGAVVMAAINQMTHYPSQPYDMDKDFYDVGYYGTSHSNIARLGTVEPKLDPLLKCIDMWMADSDNNNIGALGHRRWFLNPGMGGTAFGSAQGPNDSIFTAAYSVDKSAPVGDYDLITWPPSGYVPSDDRIFDSSTAWSVTLCPNKYMKPDGSVRVTITRESDGKKYAFASGGSNGFFTIENSGYGVDNCIIFRPDGLGVPKGRYTVEVSGIKTVNGAAVTLKYAMEFFQTVGVDVPVGPQPTVTTTEKPSQVVTTTENPSQVVTTTEKPGQVVTTTELPTRIVTTTAPYTWESQTIPTFPTIPTTGKPSQTVTTTGTADPGKPTMPTKPWLPDEPTATVPVTTGSQPTVTEPRTTAAPTSAEKTNPGGPTMPTKPWLPDDPTSGTKTDPTAGSTSPTAGPATSATPTTAPTSFDLGALLRFKDGSGIYYDAEAGVISAPQKLTKRNFFDAFATPQNISLSDAVAGSPLVSGDKFVYTDENGQQQSVPIAVRGDINADGRINSSDARFALRTSARLETLESVFFYAADADHNGKVNSSDARKILRVSAKLEQDL
ncbi:MAG: hypothetical protein IJK23_07700 [Clostridia bacterium]|nr:hypothetical protein [Clostridia bacterium]